VAAATYENPVLAWLNEMRPDRLPEPDPPPGPFTVTRSEVVIRDGVAPVVRIWYGPAAPAEPRAVPYSSATRQLAAPARDDTPRDGRGGKRR
jgi:hypothetical protein